MLDASSAHRFAPHLSTNDGTLFRPDSRGGDYEYEVISDADPTLVQPHESPPGESDKLLLSIPADLRPRLRANRRAAGRDDRRPTARRASRPAPASSSSFCATPASSATPCRWTSTTGRLDPVEDFLVNRKKGHCEYFASALALLLRSVNIPSRIVNGFKGGDWNELTETMNVRQKHAHSWVEAFIGLRPG